jgi:hypothetical protein
MVTTFVLLEKKIRGLISEEDNNGFRKRNLITDSFRETWKQTHLKEDKNGFKRVGKQRIHINLRRNVMRTNTKRGLAVIMTIALAIGMLLVNPFAMQANAETIEGYVYSGGGVGGDTVYFGTDGDVIGDPKGTMLFTLAKDGDVRSALCVDPYTGIANPTTYDLVTAGAIDDRVANVLYIIQGTTDPNMIAAGQAVIWELVDGVQIQTTWKEVTGTHMEDGAWVEAVTGYFEDPVWVPEVPGYFEDPVWVPDVYGEPVWVPVDPYWVQGYNEDYWNVDFGRFDDNWNWISDWWHLYDGYWEPVLLEPGYFEDPVWVPEVPGYFEDPVWVEEVPGYFEQVEVEDFIIHEHSYKAQYDLFMAGGGYTRASLNGLGLDVAFAEVVEGQSQRLITLIPYTAPTSPPPSDDPSTEPPTDPPTTTPTTTPTAPPATPTPEVLGADREAEGEVLGATRRTSTNDMNYAWLVMFGLSSVGLTGSVLTKKNKKEDDTEK